MPRRFLRYTLLATFGLLTLYALFQTKSWRSIGISGPRYESLKERIRDGKDILPDLIAGEASAVDPHAWRTGYGSQFKEPKIDAKSPYPVGKTKPAGSNYTRCLVIPKLLEEDTSWIEEELGDMLESGLLSAAIYAMDDSAAPLHPIKNKGNEVMAYLSYIIDSYDHLPDISIFMHSHRFAWHNNLILNEDASLMIRHLSPERVSREGYMNLRCHWEPGCPDWLHPSTKEKTPAKEEQQIFSQSWAELFPGEEVPTVLGQPCCAQFAVSRDRILSIPRERYISLRDWVLNTELSDFLAGRVLEYTWQYIFTLSAFHCPSMSVCYCDGYGLCFGGPEKFDYYFELNFYLKKYREELRVWRAQAKAAAFDPWKVNDKDGKERPETPQLGRDLWLEMEFGRIEEEMWNRRKDAWELGKDPRQRAKEAGRVWKEGDGF